jgi:SAM-dependent methyltransferase
MQRPEWWLSLGRFQARRSARAVRQIARDARAFATFDAQHRAYVAAAERAGITMPIEPFPQLGDRTSTTPVDSHYLHQGAWVNRHLRQTVPVRHVDIASAVYYLGFFAAIAPTDFVDIRPAVLNMPGVTEREGSVLALPYDNESLRSLSCLHVVEHIGLGRYGDPIEPRGTEFACAELARVLAPGGTLYVSLPVGRPRVSFNAHRVHDVAQVREYFRTINLLSFDAVLDDGRYITDCDDATASAQEYACGMFRFSR